MSDNIIKTNEIKQLTFDGNDKGWSKWKGCVKAVADDQGWAEMLLGGTVEEKAKLLSDTKEDKAKKERLQKLNNKAFLFFALSTRNGDAEAYIDLAKPDDDKPGDAFTAWTGLCHRYDETNHEHVQNLIEEFNKCG